MPINVIERAVAPQNSPTNNLSNKGGYSVYAPAAGINKPGLAGFDPRHFAVREQIVELSPSFLAQIEGQPIKNISFDQTTGDLTFTVTGPLDGQGNPTFVYYTANFAFLREGYIADVQLIDTSLTILVYKDGETKDYTIDLSTLIKGAIEDVTFDTAQATLKITTIDDEFVVDLSTLRTGNLLSASLDNESNLILTVETAEGATRDIVTDLGLGDIVTALQEIIEIQETLIGVPAYDGSVTIVTN